MTLAFDPGYGQQPFRSLCEDFPGASVYPPAAFRVEWGPIFHRGRLDGSARLLIVGQDPAQHESVVRRILVGTAGRRVQGFMAKLGLTRSYVMINTFLYSVYGQGGGEAHKKDAGIVAYRNRWLAALVQAGGLEGVVSLGSLADNAWTAFLAAAPGSAAKNLPYHHVRHPTWPESSGHNEAERKANTKTMLIGWNTALTALRPVITPDQPVPWVPYGDDFVAADLGTIPPDDLPPGLPDWMRGDQPWASREGKDAAAKRRTIVMTVPAGAMQ